MQMRAHPTLLLTLVSRQREGLLGRTPPATGSRFWFAEVLNSTPLRVPGRRKGFIRVTGQRSAGVARSVYCLILLSCWWR